MTGMDIVHEKIVLVQYSVLAGITIVIMMVSRGHKLTDP